MAELTISSDEIRGALERYVSSYTPEVSREEVGIVSDAGDGIAHVEGLPSTMANELLEFEDGTLGVALNLDVREIGVVVLGDFAGIEEGQQVKRTGRVLSVPVGDAFLGRVVDPLGEPIDGLGEIENEGFRELELQAPNVMARQPVKEPLQTGIKAIDAMTADRPRPAPADHRRPQDRQDHGRARHDHQPARQLGVRRPEEAGPLHLRRHRPEGVHDRRRSRARSRSTARWSTRPSSPRPASDPAGFKYLAPYTGSSIGQHWMYAGKHVLIVFDDLTKQAEAYRAVSLLLRRPPGREAYPGDVFYLHSRLLERCAKLSDELGGGSMTGLPIIETKANDISAFIPTNVISITDGQIFLESDLFNQGVRPAINVGTSVSRVGGAAQVKPHAQGRRPAAARPGPVPRAGGVRRLRLRPGQGVAGPAGARRPPGRAAQAAATTRRTRCEEQVVSIWAGTEGKLDDVPVGEVRRFEAEFLQYLRHRTRRRWHGDRATTSWDDDIVDGAGRGDRRVQADVPRQATASTSVNEAEAEALAEGEETHETVTRVRRPPPPRSES